MDKQTEFQLKGFREKLNQVKKNRRRKLKHHLVFFIFYGSD